LKQIDIPSFLALLSDPKIQVIKSAIAFMNSEAHNNADALKRHLTKEVLESLYKETKIRQDLIREVMMGPFKHTIDDGLEIRKAAFECLYSLLDSCHNEIDVDILLDNVENGYNDDYDVKLLTYLILLRVIQQSPSSISSRIVKFCEHTKKILNLRVKQDAVNQEAERSEELKRAVVRVVAHISNSSTDILIDTNSTRAYQDTIRLIQNFPELSKFLEQERKSSQQLVFTVSESKSDQMEF
jgi:cullin-associated NEDD8-dissociated protein 1